MEAHRVERKLAAIFAADVEAYSRLMGQDEVGTLRTLTAYRVIVDRLITSHRGRIFNTAGDSLVADFGSTVDAVECAVEIQHALAKENEGRPAGEQMRFRIGVHVGDIMVQGDNLFGDAVNVAARLEALAEPGGICVSGVARDHIGTKLAVGFADLGEQQVKNIASLGELARLEEFPDRTEPILVALRPWWVVVIDLCRAIAWALTPLALVQLGSALQLPLLSEPDQQALAQKAAYIWLALAVLKGLTPGNFKETIEAAGSLLGRSKPKGAE